MGDAPQGHMRIQLQGVRAPGANIIPSPSPSHEPKIVWGCLEIELGRQRSKRRFICIALRAQHKLKKTRRGEGS
jgi:hypothetical protein